MVVDHRFAGNRRVVKEAFTLPWSVSVMGPRKHQRHDPESRFHYSSVSPPLQQNSL